MTQTSAPVNKRPLTIIDWRHIVGDEPGIKEDVDGTAYDLEFSTNSDEVIIGSTTEDSVTVVGGGKHVIPAGQPERLVVPEPLSAARTDLIAVRYDPAWAVLPTDPDLAAAHVGPCRLHRIPGTEGSGVPPYDFAPPGIEDLVHWEVTRTPGTALSSNGTKRVDRRVRTGPNLYARDIKHIASGIPLGTVARVGGMQYTRILDAQGGHDWAGHMVNGQRAWTADRNARAVTHATDEYTGTGINLGLTLPSSAPAGDYILTPVLQIQHKTSASAGTLRVSVGSTVKACRADITTVTGTFTPSFRYTHPGGAVLITLTHQVNTGTAVVVNANTSLSAFYLGS